MLSQEAELERIEMRASLVDRGYRCRRLGLTQIFDRQRLELLRIKNGLLSPIYKVTRRAYFKGRYRLDDLLEIEGELEHIRDELKFLSGRMNRNLAQGAAWGHFNPPILDVDLPAVLTAVTHDDGNAQRTRLRQEILQNHRLARRDQDRLGLYVRANSDKILPGTGNNSDLEVGLRFTFPLGNRSDEALPYYLREIQEESEVDQWRQRSKVEAAYLELREQLRRTRRQQTRYERALERMRRSVTRHHLEPEESDLRTAIALARSLTEAAIELVLAKEESFQRVNEILRRAGLDFSPQYLHAVADVAPKQRSRQGLRSIYLWSSAFNDLENTLLLDFLETKGLGHLMVSAGRRTDRDKLSHLLRKAALRQIRVSLVLGVNEWILPGRRADALAAVLRAVDLHPDVHLDVEPQAMEGFKADRTTYLKQYLELLAAVRQRLGHTARLSVAVPVNWDIPTYRKTATLVDGIYLMAYGSSKPGTIARRIRPALDAIEADRLILVLRISDFSDEWSLEQTIDALYQYTGLNRYGIHQLSQFMTLTGGVH